MQYLYPDRGINWVQADVGDDGLPVIRARVGFSTLDGRYFLLKESGTDNVSFFQIGILHDFNKLSPNIQ